MSPITSSHSSSSQTDIVALVAFCKALHRKFREASGDHDEISHEVQNLHTVLRHLKYELEAPDSPLNHDPTIWDNQLAPTIKECDQTLRDLDHLIQGDGGNSDAAAHRVRRATDDRDEMGAIRVRLIRQNTNLTAFLDSMQLPEAKTMPAPLEIENEQLDAILDKVDCIAVRLRQQNGHDDREIWRLFKRELIVEGFSRKVLQQNEDILRAYILEMDQDGLLDNPKEPMTISSPLTSRGVKPQSDSTNQLLSPESQQGFSDGSGAKELLAREDNMKFPPSMKLERRMPEQRTKGISHLSPSVPPNVERVDKKSPPFVQSPHEKDHYYLNTDGSSEEDFDSDDFQGQPKSPTNGVIIHTSELIALIQTPPLTPPGTSNDLGAGREMRPGPASPTGSQQPIANLAPDERGNEIKPDALWTKIDRRLVSSEVLNQDGRRYEAHPEFVAILGVLTGVEIASLATRSATLRAGRGRHPIYPPHPLHSHPSTFPLTGRRTTVSSPHHSASDASEPRHRDVPPLRSILKKTHHDTGNYTHEPHIDSPLLGGSGDSDQSSREDAWGRRREDRIRDRSREREKRQKERERDEWERERERERERNNDRHRHRIRVPDHDRDRDRDRRRDLDRAAARDREPERPRRGWHVGHRDITAASIGGAAISLLNVLADVAQGL